MVAAFFLLNALRLLPRTLAWVVGWRAGAGMLADPFWFVLGMAGLFGGLLVWLLRRPDPSPTAEENRPARKFLPVRDPA